MEIESDLLGSLLVGSKRNDSNTSLIASIQWSRLADSNAVCYLETQLQPEIDYLECT